MKALVCDKYGDLDDIAYRDIHDPSPGPDDAIVRVAATGAVFTDILFAQGKYQVKPPLPFVLGAEFSGDVVAVGANVSRLKPGDRIMSMAFNFGAFAERVRVPAWLPTLMPPSLSYEAGASVMSGAGTAQHALRQRAALKAGETLVVTGAAGGTGAGAIQVGKAIGARVIAVCSSEKRAAFCRAQGANDVIDYTKTDLKSGIKEKTGGRGADVVFETVGGDVFDACARAVARGGRLLVVGFASGRIPLLPVNLALVKSYAVIGVHWMTYLENDRDGHHANMEELVRWMEQGKVAPAIGLVAPLADGVSALRRIADRDVMGKVVLRPG